MLEKYWRRFSLRSSAGDHQGSQISIDEQTFVARVVMNGSKPMK
jgi:hypothetical protein